MSQGGASSLCEIIRKKRDGEELEREELISFVSAVVNGQMQDTQIGAALMAMYIRGLSPDETTHLTRAMLESGERFAWPAEWRPLVVDKHSSGGVGDKVSIALAPALAACGLKVPMISGRGLEFTGGTLDKLEAIPGFDVRQSASAVLAIVEAAGCCIVGQTTTLVPADRVTYAHRDVTATVDSLPLIVASIVSKKAAEGLAALVLDVKVGRGGFLKTEEEARRLAEALVRVSSQLGIRTVALLTDMDQPVGRTVGNALEVTEALQCMSGRGPPALSELVGRLGGELLSLVGRAPTPAAGHAHISRVLRDGSAMRHFRQMLVLQGVSVGVAERLTSEGGDASSLLPAAQMRTTLKSERAGYVAGIDALACARLSIQLGAGRCEMGAAIDHSVGLTLLVDIGSYLDDGCLEWVTIHHNTPLTSQFTCQLQGALLLSDHAPRIRPIVIDVITSP